MVRHYKPKNRRRLTAKQRDNRMRRAVELREAGLSVRGIAERLAASVGTVHADLKRWERERPNVTPLRSETPFRSAPTGAKLNALPERPAAKIVPLRRSS